MEFSKESLVFCEHCHDEIKDTVIKREGHIFCCNGCSAVYSILNDAGLSEFYKIRSNENFSPSPVSKESNSFNYMNDVNFLKEFANQDLQEEIVLRFYLEGIHCMACIWLIEKTPEVLDGLLSARLNITDSTAEFKISKDLAPSTLAKMLQSFGYYPHPIALGDSASKFLKNEERSEILKIGVAAAAMGNVMVYAVSNYAGADGLYKDVFNWLCFGLSIPVVFYSALPFYRTSLQAIKLKSMSIDIPISIAVISGFTFSFIGLFTGSDHNYFDSITALVFLILISRYFVKKATRQGLSNKGLNTIFSNSQVVKIQNQKEIEIHSNFILPGDIIKVRSEEKIIFDGVLKSQSAQVDNSIISGESKPCRINNGEILWAGSINLADVLEMEVTAIGAKTKLGKIIDSVMSTDFTKNHIVNSADKLSRFFVWGVTLLTASQFIYLLQTQGVNVAIERALAIIIISCPCALALATPLAYINALDKLKALGIFIKDENVLENINSSKNIFLDKTGTLTKGKFEVISFENLNFRLSDFDIHTIVNTLEKSSIHPIAISLKKFFKQKDISNLDTDKNFENIEILTSLGVACKNDEDYFFFGKLKKADRINSIYTQVGLYINDILICRYLIGDEIKESTLELINNLKKLGKEIHILSGDNFQTVEHVAKTLGFHNFHSDLSPEDKSEIISKYHDTVMIGDGLNDILAFKRANVSIAVNGCADLSLRASDVFMTSHSLLNLYKLIQIAKETRSTLIRNFTFSIIYNLVGVTLAVFGHITPLLAALFMPLSSLTVVFSSLFNKRNIKI